MKLGKCNSALRLVVLTALALTAFLLIAAPASAVASEWRLTVTPNADYFLPGYPEYAGVYKIEAENVGSEPTSEALTLQNILPAGLSATEVRFYDSEFGLNPAQGPGFEFPESNIAFLCPTPLECKLPIPLGVHQKLIMNILVPVPSGVEGTLEDTAKLYEGAGTTPVAEASAVNAASAQPPIASLLHFDALLTDSSRTNPYTQAGGHPYQVVIEFNFETLSTAQAVPVQSSGFGWDQSGTGTVGEPKNVTADFPPGLIANPQGVPHCSLADFFVLACSDKTIVGNICVQAFSRTNGCDLVAGLYNIQPEGAYPGEIGVGAFPPLIISTGLRSDSDYGLTAVSIPPEVQIHRIRTTFWGIPADPAHDPMRGKLCLTGGGIQTVEENELECENELVPGHGGPAEVEETPFFTLPTECSGDPLTMVGRNDTWQVPGLYAKASVEFPAVDGCNLLSFEPTIESRPTTNLADAPSGLEFHLHVPQNEDPEGVATPSLKESVVTLPEGLAINPASGDGLGSCSEAQIGLHSEAPAACPDASKLGTVQVDTPLLSEPLKGFLYLATPHQNPSGSLLAAYIALEGQGLRFKLPGSIETDPETGQITTRFLENPQTPFEDLRLDIFGGARGALRTPAICGSYETSSVLTPFSAPESGAPATPSASFETSAAENGGSCPADVAQEPNAPRFRAGTETPQAGIYSPFSLRLVREDGSQELKALDTVLPPGLVGRIAGVPYCPESALGAAAGKSGKAEQASPSCPTASELGTVDVGAGTGPTPINVPGHAYLAGPYKGAALSLAVITPAVAGPFDLGTVVVRAALYVDPETAQIRALSDPLPTILEGIPLDVRSVTLKASRPKFTLNPTSCEESAFTGHAISVLDISVPLSQRFQVGGCKALGFKPKLSLRLKGTTKRIGHPAFTAVLRMPDGGANVAAAQVTLPSSELLDQDHIRTVCTRVQFNANACPAGAVYGRARAFTPLLDQPLEGLVYLRSSPVHVLPDLVADLNGQLHIVLVGRVDSFKGGIRNTFETVPDAPVSKFVLEMQGGRKGLLQNSVDICKAPQRATAKFTGQNDKGLEINPQLKVRCPKQAKRGRKRAS